MRVFVLSSGSSGNLFLIEDAGARLLLEAGVGPVEAAHRMRGLGGDLFPRGVDAIVLTHQHEDHMAKLAQLARATHAPIYAHAGIDVPTRVRRKFEVREYRAGTAFEAGDFSVDAFSLPHDAPQMALRVRRCGRSMALATDLGHVPPGLREFLSQADGVFLESNYCEGMLLGGPYPAKLKERIVGPSGHLGNREAALLAKQLLEDGVGTLCFGHLSRVNNEPRRVREAALAAQCPLRFRVAEHGRPFLWDLALPKPTQLTLTFPQTC